MTLKQYDTLSCLNRDWALARDVEGNWPPDNWRSVMASCERNGWVEIARHNGKAIAWRITKTGAMAAFLSKHAGWAPEQADAILALGRLGATSRFYTAAEHALKGVTTETLESLKALGIVEQNDITGNWYLTDDGASAYKYANAYSVPLRRHRFMAQCLRTRVLRSARAATCTGWL